jgi:hypothetical protein
MGLEADDPSLKRVWRLMVETEQLGDGMWRARYPDLEWSVTAATEAVAEEKAVVEAIRRREDPDEVARKVATARRHPVEMEPDDPRSKWVWRFTPQTEELPNGTWRAWFPSGGWSVTAPTENEAKDRAGQEWFRRGQDPEEVARRVAIMRQHLVEPVSGVENFDNSVLASAWQSDDPGKAVRKLLDQLGDAPPQG